MRCKLLAVVCLLTASLCSAQQQLEIYQPPSSTQPGYNDLFGANGDPVNLLAEPHVNGITVFYPWGGISQGVPVGVDTSSTGPCSEGPGSNQCLWGNVDPMLEGYIQGTTSPNPNGLAAHSGQKINLIIEMVPESGNSSDSTLVPPYVYLPSTYSSWCNNSSGICGPQDQVTCGTATSGWSGDGSAPTCTGALPFPQGQPVACANPRPGVWNYNQCHLTGNLNDSTCGGQSPPFKDVSG